MHRLAALLLLSIAPLANASPRLEAAVASGELGLHEIDPGVSINDHGNVAFIGRAPHGDGRLEENIYVLDAASSAVRALIDDVFVLPNSGADPTQTLGPGVIINDQNRVLARRRLNAIVQVGLPFGEITTIPLTYLETWDALSTSLPALIVMGDGGAGASAPQLFFLNPSTARLLPSPFDQTGGFAGLYAHPRFDNTGRAVFPALASGSNVLVTRPSIFVGADTPGYQAQPEIADTGEFILRTGGASPRIAIFPYDFNFALSQTIANAAGGFTRLGVNPSIDDAASVVGFAAETAGSRPGIFVSRRVAGVFAQPVRIAGISRNGVLDAGEIFLDLDEDQVFDPELEIDFGPYASLDLDEPVLAIPTPGGEPAEYTVVFSGANRSGKRGVFSIVANLSDPAEPRVTPDVVIEVGDRIGGLPGPVSSFALYDSLNEEGELALWVDAGTQAIATTTLCDRLTVVDYNDERLRNAAFPPTQRLASGGQTRKGLAADGVSSLLLRSRSFPDPGTLQVRIQDENGSASAADVGTLMDPVSGESGSFLNVDLSPEPGGPGFRAYVLLIAPADFVRSAFRAGDEARGLHDPRILELSSQLFPGEGEIGPLCAQTLELHRPPVLLVHGLDDGPESWKWALERDPRFLVELADYRTTNNVAFAANRRMVGREIERAIGRMRDLGIAATQADVFGHSMGGLLSRVFATDGYPSPSQRTHYRRPDNFDRGDIHKLVTVNTPHYGSVISDILVESDNSLTPLGRLTQRYVDNDPWVDRCLGCGAVRDLRTDSHALRDLNSIAVDLPVHAIYGNGATDAYQADAKKTYVAAVSCGRTISQLFGGRSDAVVSEASQFGGLGGDAISLVPGEPGLHGPVISKEPEGFANAHALRLLDEPIDGSAFDDGFPAFTGVPPGRPLCGYNAAPPTTTDILILDPPNGTIFASTQPISVELTFVNGFVPAQVIVETSREGAALLTTAQTTATLPAQEGYVGALGIQAIGVDASGRIGLSAAVEVQVEAGAGLTALHVPVPTLRIFPGDRDYQLRIRGTFDDGMERDVSAGLAGTLYEISNPAVAEVDADGKITPRRAGRAVVTATNAESAADIELLVLGVQGDGNADGVIDVADQAELESCRSGPHQAPSFVAPSLECSDYFDVDGDADVDDADLALLFERASGAVDRDSDGLIDPEDNCTLQPNGPARPDSGGSVQRDSDADGYGNVCDPDLNGDGIVNFVDLARLKQVFFSGDADADLNGDGVVNFVDLARFKSFFFKAPGPSLKAP